ncbi:MAG TPA: hypothetical protein VFL14_07340, partial [Xanthomonadales bacterium]|nr:hypothetical protein [Xanthomonadales bacterium]
MSRTSLPFACLLLTVAAQAASAPVRTIELPARTTAPLTTASLFAAGDGYWIQGFARNNASYAVRASASG